MYFSGADELKVRHNFQLSVLMHPITEAIAGVTLAMRGANRNFVTDQGAPEAFARDQTQLYRPAALVSRFPTMTHQSEFSWDDDYEHRLIILTADEPPLLASRGRSVDRSASALDPSPWTVDVSYRVNCCHVAALRTATIHRCSNVGFHCPATMDLLPTSVDSF
jgi:hypothetical protein